MLRAWRAQFYIFKDIIPSFLLGIVVFILVLLLFQALRLTEFILVQGVDLKTISYIILYMIQSFLPAIFPMSCLFSVLFTYSRLSADSEIVAMRAIGLNMNQMAVPAIMFGVITSIVTSYTIMSSGPQGNKQFEIIVTKMARQKSHTRIQSGSFSDGFYNMVLYTQKYNSQKGMLEKVFIFNESLPGAPTTIIADRGQILQSNQFGDVQTILRLIDGVIHQPNEGSYTKIKFGTYDVFASSEVSLKNIRYSPQSLSLDELIAENNKDIGKRPEDKESNEYRNWGHMNDRLLSVKTEFHKRFAIGVLPLVFSLLGLGLGAITHRRSGGGNAFVTSMLVIILFWILYISGENAAKEGTVPPWLGVWYSSLLFLSFAAYRLKKIWN